MASPLKNRVGGEYDYSNAGYNLLAAIIEIASGQSWEEFLRREFFLPAGMLHTGCMIPKWQPETLIHHYLPDGTRVGAFPERWGPEGPLWNQRGSGGILSTVGDMYRWHRALKQPGVLTADALKKFQTPYARMPVRNTSRAYGYGWAIDRAPNGELLVTHDGGNGNFSNSFLRYPDDGVVLYITSNAPKFVTSDFGRTLGAALLSGSVPVPPLMHPVTQGGEYTGEFSDGDRKLLLEWREDRVLVLANRQPLIGLVDPDAAANNSDFERLNSVVQNLRQNSPMDPAGWQALAPDLHTARRLYERNRQPLGASAHWDVLGTISGLQGRAGTVVHNKGSQGEEFLIFDWDRNLKLADIERVNKMPGLPFYLSTENDLVLFRPFLVARLDTARAARQRSSHWCAVAGRARGTSAVHTIATLPVAGACGIDRLQ